IAASSSCRRCSRNRCTSGTSKAAVLAEKSLSPNESASENISTATVGVRIRQRNLDRITKTAAARGNSVFANRARSKRKVAACDPEQRSEIPDLDASLEHFAGLDRRDTALRRQILLEASGR